MSLHEQKLKFLEETAADIRYDAIEAVINAGSGHVAGPLDMADVFTALYFHVLNHDPKNPNWPERDRLILSNGHICPIQYAALARAGYFPVEELQTLRRLNSRLQGHPHRTVLPGIETTSGPLGSGLSQSCGMALAGRLDKKKYFVYCSMSDGEQQCGNTWEAAMFAGKYKLNHLIGVIDRNNIQISGMTEEIMPLDSLRAKYEAFNWHVLEIDGHNIQQFVDAVHEAKAIYERPTVIITHTIAGKGVGFMEGDYLWHSKAFSQDEARQALEDLRMLKGRVKSEHQ
jgi:transketolase